MNSELKLKVKESICSVLPITVIVLLLHFTIAPMSNKMFGLFLVGVIMLILGMGLFTLGVDMAMMIIGEKIGSYITASKNKFIIASTVFLIGMLITVAEPDLQVLAKQVPTISNYTIILSVSFGVGIFLVISMFRMLMQIKLHYLLIVFYIGIFIMCNFVSQDILSVAFDSGGVTTGPITVPFIIALGIGISHIRGDKTSEEDSFGLVALCSIGPILAVIIMSFFSNGEVANYSEATFNNDSISKIILEGISVYAKEVFIALLPIVLFFFVFQFVALKIKKTAIIKIIVGLVYTYFGLVLFLLGVNVGFMPTGLFIGKVIGAESYSWILIPIGILIGYFIILAEPAVHVLNKQVEEITGGTITRSYMNIGLSIGVALAVGISMVRLFTDISLLYFLIPGYLIALGLSFFVPSIFTSIAFDSGGVASGPMTATFLLPFAIGACGSLGGNILTDAFGLVAMVAMTPLITIQILGLIYKLKINRRNNKERFNEFKNNEVIDFDEEE